MFLVPHLALAGALTTHFSGYAKSLNFFTRTSGFVPEFAKSPLARVEEDENIFSTSARIRLKSKTTIEIEEGQKVSVAVDYDHQAYFGSFVNSGDFRVSRNLIENRQFLDLSQTFVEDEDGFYEHRFYRFSLIYENPHFDWEIGRQQIPWGVGHFFTPTDLFNPFNPTQIELDERDGVDASKLTTKRWKGIKAELIYTPEGRELHPQRFLGKLSKDIRGYEVSLLGGRMDHDHAVGLDLSGNLKNSAVRGEFLYREAEFEKDFIKFTVNADYNFPYNIYGLLEYHYNGQGRSNEDDYQLDRLIRGDIQQLSKNYFGLLLGYDLTSLIRLESRTLFNANDQSVFQRPEVQYEIRPNLLLTAGAQLYLGENADEFGSPKNLYLLEAKQSF